MSKKKKPISNAPPPDRVLADGRLGDRMLDPISAAIASKKSSAVEMVQTAIAQRRAVLAYQPVVSASDYNTPVFYEGFIRIFDRAGRPIPAGDFIGHVEDTLIGRQIDCITLELGLHALLANPDLRLSINVSARSIGFPNWGRILRNGIAKNKNVGHRLTLEITESSAMAMPELVTAFMSDVQSTGLSFALDDFGGGATSFRHLRHFLFDIVKFHGTFCCDIATNADNQVVMETLVQIGKNYDMLCVACQVEDASSAQFLTSIGVNFLQGFYFGAPKLKQPAPQRASSQQPPTPQS